ncbi:D-Ala-D-Ala carboxypeptidase family metallohydrolase [Sphingomicrobium sp. XHP0239]|uniref:D-Ala-D-Ala carboxypeptidase family metallohydrolase n=1 Tax=Sphingomicrobium maritimum TaxID=3133972 RepID=UPI0031CC65E5
MADAVSIGERWGRVTSTFRTPDHNRRVGGVRNSHHLRNRAIDIARARGVSHRQIEQAYRQAGYVLVESLDEGDHSHFAFANRSSPKPADPGNADRSVEAATERDRFRIVLAPGSR